jgi:steroid delta-isomerase
MATPEAVRSAAEHYIEALNKRDLDAIVACFAEDAVHRDPATAPPNAGREAIRTFFENALSASDSWTVEPLAILACGRQAALHLAFDVRSGRSGDTAMTLDVIELLDVGDDGLLTTLAAYWDAQQMEVAPVR